MDSNDLYGKIQTAVVDGRRDDAADLARQAVARKLDLNEVIEKGYTPGLQKVGELWEKGDYFLPELVASAECMKAAMAVLQPEFERSRLRVRSQGRVVIGTIEGDIHDIGKNLVSAMLSASGFQVFDLGADVKLERFLEAAEAENADLVCLSALLTTTMLGQKRFVELVRERGLAGRFKIVVGGAPVTREWAADIGADGFGENAVAAVQVAKNLTAAPKE
jgi:corrinoid protein of di/trimethylamine methyltransferase